jgi:hypothetical protein
MEIDLEEYNPELKYIKGEENVVADARQFRRFHSSSFIHEANAMAGVLQQRWVRIRRNTTHYI